MILRSRHQIRTYFNQFFRAFHIYFIFVLDVDTGRSSRISNGIKMGMSGIIQVNQSRRYDFDIPNPRIKSPIHICSRAIIQIIIRFPSEGHSTLVTVKMTYRKFFGTSPFRQLGGCIQGTTIPNILIPVGRSNIQRIIGNIVFLNRNPLKRCRISRVDVTAYRNRQSNVGAKLICTGIIGIRADRQRPDK